MKIREGGCVKYRSIHQRKQTKAVLSPSLDRTADDKKPNRASNESLRRVTSLLLSREKTNTLTRGGGNGKSRRGASCGREAGGRKEGARKGRKRRQGEGTVSSEDGLHFVGDGGKKQEARRVLNIPLVLAYQQRKNVKEGGEGIVI